MVKERQWREEGKDNLITGGSSGQGNKRSKNDMDKQIFTREDA